MGTVEGTDYCDDFDFGANQVELFTYIAPADITLQASDWGGEISWQIADATGAVACSAPGGTYSSDTFYDIESCFLVGGTEYTLTCTDTFGDGWHGGYITVEGTDYCGDFVSGATQVETFTY